MDTKDELSKIAYFYKENFCGKKYHLKAGKRGQIIEFDIVFKEEHFVHLTGLHKLTDIPQIKKNNTSSVFRSILNGQLLFTTIQKSKYYKNIENRINCFYELRETVFTKELMVKSLDGYFNKIDADYMLTKNKEIGYLHLFLKNKTNYAIPITFIYNENDNYLRNKPNKWTILSVEEITDK